MKITLKDKFYWWLYNKVNESHYKNKMGIVSGWWQAGNLDRKAWEYLKKEYPTKGYWLTSEYKVKHYKMLKKINRLVYEVHNLKLSSNKKGNRVATLDLELWRDTDLITVVSFKFVEKMKIKVEGLK